MNWQWKMINILDIKSINQYWNSILLQWYHLTHYYNISDILDKINIDYYNWGINKLIKLQAKLEIITNILMNIKLNRSFQYRIENRILQLKWVLFWTLSQLNNMIKRSNNKLQILTVNRGEHYNSRRSIWN